MDAEEVARVDWGQLPPWERIALFTDPQRAPLRLLWTLQTCWCAPYQWDAYPVVGGYLYLRYRHGRGRVEYAPSKSAWWRSADRDSFGGVTLDEWSDGSDRDVSLEDFCASTHLQAPPAALQFGRVDEL